LYGFSSQKTSLFDPVYEFSKTTLLIDNLIDFSIEEVLFHLLNCSFEPFLVFKLPRLSVHIQIPTTIIVPPHFGVLGNVYDLGMFMPYSVNIVSE